MSVRCLADVSLRGTLFHVVPGGGASGCLKYEPRRRVQRVSMVSDRWIRSCALCWILCHLESCKPRAMSTWSDQSLDLIASFALELEVT